MSAMRPWSFAGLIGLCLLTFGEATRENSMRVFLPAHECQMNGERTQIWQRCGVVPHAAHSIECHQIF
jgi:hypothetical protein